jgi:hypothetical protein
MELNEIIGMYLDYFSFLSMVIGYPPLKPEPLEGGNDVP